MPADSPTNLKNIVGKEKSFSNINDYINTRFTIR